MNTFIRLLSILKPQLPLMVLGAFVSVITVLANISLLAISGWFITLMAIAGLSGVTANYFTPAAIIRFLAIVRTAGRYLERMLTHRATFNALAQFRYYFYRKLEPLLPYYQVDLRSGDLLARLQYDIDNLDNFYLRVLLPIFVAIISLPILYFALLTISPTIAWLLCTSLLVVALLLPIVSYWLSLTHAKDTVDLDSQLTDELIVGIGAIKTLLVYQVNNRFHQKVSNITQQYYAARYQLTKINASLNVTIFLLINMCALVSLIVLLTPLHLGTIDSKTLVAVILLVLVSFETVQSMPLALQLLPQSLASAARLFEIIDKVKPIENGQLKFTHGDIFFDHLTFTYPEQTKACLHDISLTLGAGKKVAIIGASGAGKSTLANLLMGFWPTENTTRLSHINTTLTHGSVTIDGTSLLDIDKTSLRDHIALMNQQGHIFDGTIADNLRLAKHDATTEEMYQACQQVNLQELIDSLPDGLDTWLGSTGIGLSGGQAQRLQIAQVFLRPASVLILDEPTKGLDKQNEKIVMNNLLDYANTHNKSLLLITHKPFMLEKMDNIALMEQGKITLQGKHQQLLNHHYYKNLLSYF